jgi:hypothetical protein
VSALIAKFEVSDSTLTKEDLEAEQSIPAFNNSHKYPPLRNARSATPESKLSPPTTKKRPSSSASCNQSESYQLPFESHNNRTKTNPGPSNTISKSVLMKEKFPN